jgi:hypothetical protein
MKSGFSVASAYELTGPELLRLVIEELETDKPSIEQTGQPQNGE